MDLRDLAIFRMADRRTSWLSQQQKVVAENVANADTPRYRAKDVRKVDFKKMTADAVNPTLKPVLTHAAHIADSLPDEGPYREDRTRRTWETSIDQNPVVLEEQIEKAARGRSAYAFALELYRKNLQMLKSALGGGSGGAGGA